MVSSRLRRSAQVCAYAANSAGARVGGGTVWKDAQTRGQHAPWRARASRTLPRDPAAQRTAHVASEPDAPCIKHRAHRARGDAQPQAPSVMLCRVTQCERLFQGVHLVRQHDAPLGHSAHSGCHLGSVRVSSRLSQGVISAHSRCHLGSFRGSSRLIQGVHLVRQSTALSGTQRHSAVLSGTQWHSEALRGNPRS